jgi:hypothetical protein
MLYYVAREQHRYTIDRLLRTIRQAGRQPPDHLRVATYEGLLAVKRAPIGSYVFTDLDRLTSYEIEAATEIAHAVRHADARAMISNWPNRVLGRYALLRRLHEAGINSYNVWRLDEERMPTSYPVFIRREQDALGPETPLLHDESEYRAAVAQLRERRRALIGRIAVQFCQSADEAGMYRKYGALYFRGDVVPQHLFLSRDWMVKRSTLELTPDMMAAEERYVFENPHADQIRAIFALAETDFGRIDYTIVDGRVQTFEINTNPNFPRMRLDPDGRLRRRLHVVEQTLLGFKAMDGGVTRTGLTRFRTPKPKLHRLRNRSIWRRAGDLAALLRWRANALLNRR